MKQHTLSLKNAYLIAILVVLIDQATKIYIKTHFLLGEEVEVFSWFKIYFIENEGMAWGTQIPGQYGKLCLTVFRLFAVAGIAYWLWDSIQKKRSSNYLIVAITLIMAGAFGNILDSVFYGVTFNDSQQNLAHLFSDKPYGSWFHGKVVDLFYFPIWKGTLPHWLPIWGGNPFTFFNAIFNVADLAISTGVGILLVFNKKAFRKNPY